MTLAELRSFIRLQLSEENEAFYQNENLDTYIIQGIKRFANKTQCIIYQETITYSNGTGIYTLTYKPLKERSLAIYPSDNGSDVECPLHPIAYEDFQRISDRVKYNEGYCYINNRANQIHLSTLFSNSTIYFEYSVKATESDALTLLASIPDEYHEAIAEYALYLAYRKDRELALANTYYGTYKSIEKEARIEIAEREVLPYGKDFSTQNMNPHKDSFSYQDEVHI